MPDLGDIDAPVGAPFQDDGPPDLDPKDNPKAAGRDDRAAPHVTTFAALFNQFSRSYSYRSDEALKHSPSDALAMRRDALYRALLQERLLPTARRKWQLEVDNAKDPRQKQVKQGLTACIKGIPYFTRMRYYLLEAEWYGRYGSQGTWERNPEVRDEQGNALYTFCRHQPVNGDKIQFQWDGTPAVMISQQHKWPEGSVIYGDRAPMLRLHRPEWRRQFVIHRYNPEDADYFNGEEAGAVNGVGLRSMVYWSWWMREEMLGWAVDFMQKVGTLGLLIFWYEYGNKAAEKQAESNAKAASNRAAFVMPHPGGKGEMPPGGVEQIAPQTGGIEALQDMIANYWERHQERLIVGQSMSGGADHEDGLGGTGRADFAKDTKYQILAYSAENLDETLTQDLVRVAKKLNYPWADFPIRFKSIVPDPEKAEKLKTTLEVIDRVPVAVKDIRELADMREPDEGEETVGGPQAMMPGLTPPGQPSNGKPLGGILGDRANGKPLGGLLGNGTPDAPEAGGLDLDALFDSDLADWFAGQGTQTYLAEFDESKVKRDAGRFATAQGRKGGNGGNGTAAAATRPAAGGGSGPGGLTDSAAVRQNWPRIKARLGAVRVKLMELAARIDPTDVLPTADDYARISVQKGMDPLAHSLGIPMYDAALVFSHAVAWAVTRAKQKMAGRPQTYAAGTGVRDELLALFLEFVGKEQAPAPGAGDAESE